MAIDRTQPIGPAAAPQSKIHLSAEGPKSEIRPGPSFQEALRGAARGVQFSNHAAKRIERRDLDLDPARLDRLNSAISRAAEKGSRNSVVMLDDLAVVVDIRDGQVSFTIPAAGLGTGADPLTFTLDVTSFTQYAGASQANLQSQSGSAAGALVSFAVGSTGEVTGIYSNGANRVIGQLALATFTNPGGLQRQGQNLWAPSSNSGEAIVGRPNENGRGSVSTGTLESSNVDLAQQFTNVILAQRGFQSSSRVITAGDQMLQDLVNIIR